MCVCVCVWRSEPKEQLFQNVEKRTDQKLVRTQSNNGGNSFKFVPGLLSSRSGPHADVTKERGLCVCARCVLERQKIVIYAGVAQETDRRNEVEEDASRDQLKEKLIQNAEKRTTGPKERSTQRCR